MSLAGRRKILSNSLCSIGILLKEKPVAGDNLTLQSIERMFCAIISTVFNNNNNNNTNNNNNNNNNNNKRKNAK